jgi:translation initiation factor 2 alpha subunit (eIF-2alpha)
LHARHNQFFVIQSKIDDNFPHNNKRKATPRMKFYQSTLPPEGAIVAIRVDAIMEYGVVVTLLEYDVTGLIVAGEISRRRIRSIKEVVRVGQETAAAVTKIDDSSGTVDLSLKMCTPDEITEALMKYGQHRTVYNFMKSLAEITGESIESHFAAFVWPALERDEDIYAQLVSLNTPDCDVDAVLGSTPHKAAILELARKRLPTPTFTASRIERLMSLDSLRAPELLTSALHAAAATSADIAVWVVSPPEYKFVATHIRKRKFFGATAGLN